MDKDVVLILATEKEATLIHEMKYEAFLPLYNKYHDDDTNPVKETIESVIRRIQREHSQYYIIRFRNKSVGAIYITNKKRQQPFIEGVYYISPFFILPEFQNRGIGQKVLQLVFNLYKQATTWKLDTIKQEAGNCHLYEKCGFVRIGEEYVINENMTLVGYEKKF